MLNELFQEYYGEKIALYGLGTETKKLLCSFEDRFKIIGLLDSFRDCGRIYGKEIISLHQAMAEGAKLIIVIARPGSCKAIAKRIGEACRSQGIALLDIRGKDLLEKKQVIYNFDNVKGGTREELIRKIEKAEVISFDLFDTLIMREVLASTDIVEMTNVIWKEKGILIPDFVSKRLDAEKKLSRDGAPVLESLYEDVLKRTEGVSVSAMELAEMEWKIDCKTIVRRKAMCEIFEYCIGQKKAVYIVTDTYYHQDQIEKMLKKCYLTEYTGLLVSCEYCTGKRQNLFGVLKSIEGEKKYLHIGDDLMADIEMASTENMDTYRVFSGEELLDTVGNMGLENCMNSLAERMKAGLFVARLFNNPFQFEMPDRRIVLSNAYDIGYLICAPIITDFVFWFWERVKYYGIRNIWFCARDGYLLKKMYQMLDENTETVYFQTSRVAAIRAGMMDEDDIFYVDSMRFSGTTEENLKIRFGIETEETGIAEESVKCNLVVDSGLLKYKEKILENAMNERKKYSAYINKLDIKEGDIAFFDFVAKGTTQMYVQRLTDHHLKGLYFLHLEPDFMSNKGLDIEPFYRRNEMDKSIIYDNYYVLETILTAPHSCVWGIDEAGKPIYAKETRKEKDIKCFERVQEGILDYFCRYMELIPSYAIESCKKLDELFLGLLHHLKITDEDFLSLVVEDPFFNRRTDITELI